jgi:hypothetical protein
VREADNDECKRGVVYTDDERRCQTGFSEHLMIPFLDTVQETKRGFADAAQKTAEDKKLLSGQVVIDL